MRGSKMPGLLVTLLLSLTAYRTSDATHENRLQPAVVVGTVYCDTCSQQGFSKSSHFISGATVAVECKEGTNSNSNPSFRQEVKTYEHGEFKVNLPFSVTKHAKNIETCSVKLISSSEPSCSVPSSATTSSLLLKSRKEDAHLFSAGALTFKPLKQPKTCKEAKPSMGNSEEFKTQKTEIPVVGDLPPIPLNPNLPPPLPLKSTHVRPEAAASNSKAAQTSPIPFLPPIPLLPPIPNPFQPPPVLPPNPLQPPPLFPPFLPPNPLFPPPPPLIPLPPIPGLTPPRQPPAFPFPLPPFPIPPFPGVPPATTNSQKTASP